MSDEVTVEVEPEALASHLVEQWRSGLTPAAAAALSEWDYGALVGLVELGIADPETVAADVARGIREAARREKVDAMLLADAPWETP